MQSVTVSDRELASAGRQAGLDVWPHVDAAG